MGPRDSNMTHSRLFVLFALLSAGAYAQWVNYPDAAIPRTPDGKPDLTGVWMHEITTVADVRRLFGSRFEDAIKTGAPGMEIGTQHKYNFDILLDFRGKESPMRPGVELRRAR